MKTALVLTDWLVIGAGCLIPPSVGLYFSRRSSRRGSEGYFAGNRDVPWWAIGLSNTATYQSGNGAFVTIVLVYGLAGNWLWWASWIIWMPLVAIVWARLWRRVGDGFPRNRSVEFGSRTLEDPHREVLCHRRRKDGAMKNFFPFVLVLAPALISCTPTRNEPGETEKAGKSTPVDARPLPASAPEALRATELSGRKIETAAEGPWAVRRTAGRTGASMPGAPMAAGGMTFAGTDGAPPPPGAAPEGSKLEPASVPSLARGEGEAAGGGAGAGGLAGSVPAPARRARSGAPAAALAEGRPAAAEDEAVPQAREVQAPLRAGSSDDNADFEKFLRFLATWSDKKDVASQVDFIDVADRRFIRVVNRQGKPVPAARVQVVDEAADRALLSARTYGDGRAPFYPRVPPVRPGTGAPAAGPLGSSLLVEASLGEARKRVSWDGKGEELTIEIDVPEPAKDPLALDVLFLIDTTGSMGDEIGRIKATLLEVTRKLRSIEREFDLRYGAVLYRDLGDEYITKVHPFTTDIEAFDRALKPVGAGGGGDEPESLNQGLAEAVRMEFRERAAKVMFLIADAPPHMDYPGDSPYGESLRAAVAAGIRIHSVAASGLNPTGTFVFRQIAQYTRGKFIFIEYGSAGASAESHGVEGKVSSNNLDDIIFTEIREEVARWGRS